MPGGLGAPDCPWRGERCYLVCSGTRLCAEFATARLAYLPTGWRVHVPTRDGTLPF
jgi:hypothetical protein